ncbi:hypothetical protein BDV93DRAFT_564154, partial [Ceratobasidium sp. AG-I]
NKSRRHPYSSINRHVLQLSQLSQIKLAYGLTEELDLEERQSNIATGTHYDNYTDLVFVTPQRYRVIQPPLVPKVAKAVSRKTGIHWELIRDRLANCKFTAWGKMQRIIRSDGGDVAAGDLVRGRLLSPNEGTCDASHVQYYSTKSHWRWDGGAAIDVPNEIISYGRAEQFIVIDAAFLRECSDLNNAPFPYLDPLVLAIISPIPYLRLISESGIIQYRLRNGKYANPEVVDATNIDLLVGRVTTPIATSYIVERDTVVGQMDMLDVTSDPSLATSEWSTPPRPGVVINVGWSNRWKLYFVPVVAISRRKRGFEPLDFPVIPIVRRTSVSPGVSDATIDVEPQWPFDDSYCYTFKDPATFYCLPSQPLISAIWETSHSNVALLNKKLRPYHDPLKWYPEIISPISDIRHDVRMRRGSVKIYGQLSPLSLDHISASTSIDWFSGRAWFDECIKASRHRDLDNGRWWTGALFEEEYDDQDELPDS